ncbi:MAG TPA: hypothetical protein VHF22_05675 [Planctomycetota bacterium]|nr:hypothetical protein [Planctomycetota bacterium]
MGVTIHYRGSLDRPDSVDEVQDRVLDLALALGGRARYWFSRGDGPAGRPVRGVFVDLAPGCETVALLFSPEGALVSPFEIAEAEEAPVSRESWVFAKTQFGPVEAHVALVALLRFLRNRFMSDLEVQDEGGYWDTGDLGPLLERRGLIGRAIGAIEAGLRDHPLSAEAAEDPSIIAARVESVARLVHSTLRRAPEHAPVRAETEGDLPGQGAASEAFDEAALRESAREVERLVERVAREGEDTLARDLGETAGGETTLDAGSDPLLRRASDLFLSLRAAGDCAALADGLSAGLCEVMRGLAPASADDEDADDRGSIGLRLARLKRALRGFAFAAGSLHEPRVAGVREIGGVPLKKIASEIESLSRETLERIREPRRLADRPL